MRIKPFVTGGAETCDSQPGPKHTLYGNGKVLWQDPALARLIGTEEMHFSFFYLYDSCVGCLVDSFSDYLSAQLTSTYTLSFIGEPHVNWGGQVVVMPDPTCELVSVLMRCAFEWVSKLDPKILCPMQMEKQSMHMVVHPPDAWLPFARPDGNGEQTVIFLRARAWFQF